MPTVPHPGHSPSRRRLLRAGTALLGAPALLSARARAAGGELNLLAWEHTLPDTLLEAFNAASGIRVRRTAVGSNDEILNKMRATGGRGVDLLCPTNTRAEQWRGRALLQPIELARLRRDALYPNLLAVGQRDWDFGGGPHWLPYTWGSEAIAWRTDMWRPGEALSYADLWQPALRGRVMMQPHSGMLAAGLALEARGQLPPGAMRRAYRDETEMRRSWQQLTDYCVAHKAQVKLFWNDAEAQVNALLNEGILAGQAWDGPALALRAHGEPVGYRAPREGALAWVDGFALSAEASNLPQAYAFLDFCLDPARAGAAIRAHGYNSAVVGAESHAERHYRDNFRAAYTPADLQNLWIWPSEPDWYAAAREQFRNQFVNA